MYLVIRATPDTNPRCLVIELETPDFHEAKQKAFEVHGWVVESWKPDEPDPARQ